ncbi:acetate--CoA ligase family protein [bacterium SCSIO 12827]|nr:acetate--CoA ligase family protein [bacterium SCSIO 12827]
MNFEEHAGKPLLKAAGIPVPSGGVATTADEAADIAAPLGKVAVKAQVPTGKRGKAGGIKIADDAAAAKAAASAILGMTIGEHVVEKVLIEQATAFTREFYAAVINDPETKGPKILFSTLGGMDVEEAAEQDPNAMRGLAVDIRKGPALADVKAMLAGADLGGVQDAVADLLMKLYDAYAANDAELMEINPLAVTEAGGLIALDCKFTMDDSAIPRHAETAKSGTPDKLTGLEAKGKELDLKYIELEGDVGVIANGAGLTMTTMDVVRHHGGTPANFLEIGGESYTKGTEALSLVLDNPKVKSLVINFCGAFARTDVMTDGILKAWEELKPTLPTFWSVHGTGDVEAVAMLKERIGVDPLPDMSAACKAAVEAAKNAGDAK